MGADVAVAQGGEGDHAEIEAVEQVAEVVQQALVEVKTQPVVALVDPHQEVQQPAESDQPEGEQHHVERLLAVAAEQVDQPGQQALPRIARHLQAPHHHLAVEEHPGLLEQPGPLQVQAQVAVGFLGFLKQLQGGCHVAAVVQLAPLALLQQLPVPDDVVQARAIQAYAQQVAVAQVGAVQVGVAQVGLHQRTAAQVEGEQVGVLQVGAVQVGVPQDVAVMAAVVDQVDAGQAGALELKAGHRLAAAGPLLQGRAEFLDLALVRARRPPVVVILCS